MKHIDQKENRDKIDKWIAYSRLFPRNNLEGRYVLNQKGKYNKIDKWIAYSRLINLFSIDDLEERYVLKPEIIEWLEEHCAKFPEELLAYAENDKPIGYGLYFEYDQDAVLFKLTWCNDER